VSSVTLLQLWILEAKKQSFWLKDWNPIKIGKIRRASTGKKLAKENLKG